MESSLSLHPSVIILLDTLGLRVGIERGYSKERTGERGSEMVSKKVVSGSFFKGKCVHFEFVSSMFSKTLL